MDAYITKDRRPCYSPASGIAESQSLGVWGLKKTGGKSGGSGRLKMVGTWERRGDGDPSAEGGSSRDSAVRDGSRDGTRGQFALRLGTDGVSEPPLVFTHQDTKGEFSFFLFFL
jgi:hypothetical protein